MGDENFETANVEQNGIYTFTSDVDTTRFTVEWTSKYGMICDLDLHVYCYDERARFIEKLDADLPTSKDGSCTVLSDIDADNTHSSSFIECVSIDLDKVDPATTAILLFLDGGPRNFQFVQTLTVSCLQVPSARKEGSFLPDHGKQIRTLFQMHSRARKDYQGIALCVLYKDGWVDDKTQWMTKSIMEPVNLVNTKDKDERCVQLVIGAVPALEKFRPRLFATVRDLCAALSSRALPRLKKQFQQSHSGLALGRFTEVLFKQLYESHPKIAEEAEAAYTVAMMQEMFSQIDYNGDLSVDWNEFTSFCIQTGLGDGNMHAADTDAAKSSSEKCLDEYVIEYGEDVLLRDRVLSSHRYVEMMRYFPETRKFAVINEDSNYIMFLDDKFRTKSELYPTKVQVLGTVGKEKPERTTTTAGSHHRAVIYDVAYLHGRDMYAFCSSDHSLTICKEQISMGGNKTNYVQHNKMYHSMLHLKLCWSAAAKLLCSIASDRTIYGWDCDRTQPIFQISRHSDIITDFIAVDHMEIFITCSMDRRIVMWSASTRRVKGVLIGHKRGVRCLSYHENTLLSAGFETTAKTWDMVSKDPVAVLKGHRQPIRTARLMCQRAQTEKDYRAITVDEGGEFRLWNIYVKERTSEPMSVPTLQIFEMNTPESPLNEIRFLVVPNHPKLSTGYYSDLVACGTKMLHFLPEKNAKEFVPPTCCVFNESSAAIATAVGRSLMKYDVCSGNFISMFQDLYAHELTALCLDGERGRRLFIGCSDGAVLLVNFMTGVIICKLEVHTREVTSIQSHRGHRHKIYTGSLDGKLKVLEESGGDLRVHNSVEHVFDDNLGITNVHNVPSLKVLVVSAAGPMWGIWNQSTLKKIMLINEPVLVHGIEVLGATGDGHDQLPPTTPGQPKRPVDPIHANLLTVAVALTTSIRVYTVNVREGKGVASFELTHGNPFYVNDFKLMKSPRSNLVNYSMTRQNASVVIGQQLIAATDDGTVILWDANNLRDISESKFKTTFPASNPLGFGAARRISSAPPGSPGRVSTATAASQPAAATAAGTNSKEAADESVATTGALSPSPTRETASFLTAMEEQKSIPGSIFGEALNGPKVVFETTDFIYPLGPGVESVMELQASTRFWQGHNDAVTAVTPLHEHGCAITVSLDGYHRVWNIDTDSLGELPLPNLTERMKSPLVRVVECKGWRFILERIPVTQAHRDLAHILLQKILALQNADNSSLSTTASSHRKNAAFLVEKDLNKALHTHSWDSALLDGSVELLDEKTRTRFRALKSLSEPPTLPSDAPPDRVLSKEEKKFLQLSNSLHASQEIHDKSTHNIFDHEDSKFGEGESTLGPLGAAPLTATPGKPGTPGKSRSRLGTASSMFNSESTFKAKHMETLWCSSEDHTNSSISNAFICPPAFSEPSISLSKHDGFIDSEADRILRKIATQPDKVIVYERAQPVIFLRNPRLSCTVQMPSLETIRRAEVNFGAQKDMYKNADRYLRERDRLSKPQMLNAIALARIERSVRKVHSMVHILPPPTHDDVVLPKAMAAPGSKEAHEDLEAGHKLDDQKMQLRLMQSAAMVPHDAALRARPLDKAGITALADKVAAAHEFGNDKFKETKKAKKVKKAIISHALKDNLERKLHNSIRDAYKIRQKLFSSPSATLDDNGRAVTPKDTKKILTTRTLLPFYTLDDVHHFMDIFAKVDEDFSGDLDIHEWVKLFSSINQNIPAQEARMIFMKVDKNGDGYLSMKELIPVVFNKATKDQLKLILQYTDSEIVKKHDGMSFMTQTEIDQLFECYDVDNIGFVSIAIVKERIKGMGLSEGAIFQFMDSIVDIEDDEMVNQVEFLRIMKPYLVKDANF